MKSANYLFLLLVSLLFTSPLVSQSSYPAQRASFPSLIEKKVNEEGLLQTERQLFLVKVYTLEKVTSGVSQHWFVKLSDHSNQSLNFAKVKLDGYLKDNNSVRLRRSVEAVPLGTDGKYIIKSISVPQKGTWQFNVTIDDEGETDNFTFETVIY